MIYLYKCSREGCRSTRETDVTTIKGPCGKCGAPMVLGQSEGYQEPSAPAPPAEKPKPKAKPKKRRTRKRE